MPRRSKQGVDPGSTTTNLSARIRSHVETEEQAPHLQVCLTLHEGSSPSTAGHNSVASPEGFSRDMAPRDRECD